MGFMVNHTTHHTFNLHRAAVAGIEPATRRLTVAFPYQHRPHRITSVSVAGFEPTVSCARGTRISNLSHTLKSKSAQSDLNRPNCPGRAARYRYIMGAKSSGQIVKDPGTSSGTGRT